MLASQLCQTCPVRPDLFYGASIDPVEHRMLVRRLPARSLVALAGADATTIFTLRSGWAMYYRNVAGGRRQILEFALPGDFVNLDLLAARDVGYSVQSITDVVLCGHSASAMHAILAGDADARMKLVGTLLGTLRRASDRIVTLGTRNALQGLASLILDLRARLTRRGMAADGAFAWPLSQEIIGDYLGITRVHVTRTLARLREDRLIEIEGGRLAILDQAGLERLAELG